MKKWIVLLVIIGALGVWGTAHLRRWRAQGQDPIENAAASAVAGITNVQFAINAAGDIGPAEQVSVRPETNGKIETLPVDIGDKVKKRNVLFTM